jgi:hypothetical protein
LIDISSEIPQLRDRLLECLHLGFELTDFVAQVQTARGTLQFSNVRFQTAAPILQSFQFNPQGIQSRSHRCQFFAKFASGALEAEIINEPGEMGEVKSSQARWNRPTPNSTLSDDNSHKLSGVSGRSDPSSIARRNSRNVGLDARA